MIVALASAVQRIARGELIAYPTETVYGLAADATSPAAVARLEALKGRAPGQGISVLLAAPEELGRWVPELPARAAELARRFWPGPLTLVLPGADPCLAAVATPLGVGFRCSPHPAALALARAARCPVLSTSCNRSGEPPARTAAEVVRAFGAGLALLEGEPAGGLAPSTVVAVEPGGALRVLREGALPAAQLLGAREAAAPGARD